MQVKFPNMTLEVIDDEFFPDSTSSEQTYKLASDPRGRLVILYAPAYATPAVSFHNPDSEEISARLGSRFAW